MWKIVAGNLLDVDPFLPLLLFTNGIAMPCQSLIANNWVTALIVIAKYLRQTQFLHMKNVNVSI